MEKKKYIQPVCQVTEIECSQLIAVSGATPGELHINDEPENDFWGD